MARAQAWYLDVVMAVFIFTAGIIAYHHYSLNTGNVDKERIKEISFQADALSTELLSSGYPKDWNGTTIIKIGITGNDQRIDERKWVELSMLNYTLSKQILGITHDFAIFFEDGSGNATPIGGVCKAGSPKVQITLVDNSTCTEPILPKVSDLLVRERYVFAQGNILSMKVYVFS